MKKYSVKKKIFFALSFVMLCSVLLCSVFSINNKNQTTEVTDAVIEYVDSGVYVNELYKPNKVYDSSYNMMLNYPLASENQTDSNLCWIYSSLKVLESSFMVQKNEYHNFSEIGSAYLYFVNITNKLNKDDSLKIINMSGNFANFNILAQTYGLIYESSFSNDLYFDIDEANFENYSYILDYVDTSIMDNVRPINLHGDVTFSSLERDDKIQVMKEYILNYGGLFGGLERGIISGGMYTRTDEPSHSENDGYIGLSHAVCIIGWSDERQAFLALNSWGVSTTSFSTFYIPYDYAYIYSDVYGYICVDNNSKKLEQVSSTAGGNDGFSKVVNTSFKDQDNLFAYGENVEFVFEVKNSSNFDNVFVNVYKGLENVTDQFSIDFYDDTQRIVISCNNPLTLGEGYFIKFLDVDRVIAYKDFYVFTGTEVSYIRLIEDNNEQDIDSTLFNNNYVSGTFSQTYYVYNTGDSDYVLDIYLPGFNGYSRYNNDIFEPNVFAVQTDENGNISRVPETKVRATVSTVSSTIRNLFRVRISNLVRNNKGKVFVVTLSLSSRLTSAVSTYEFTFFIGSDDSSETKFANKIVYELDGGKNSPFNVNRYPDYNYEDEEFIFAYPLSNPTKFNSTFIGWYLDKNFTVEITEISPLISVLLGKTPLNSEDLENTDYYSQLLQKLYNDDIVIYARWEMKEVDYFDIDLSILKLTDYFEKETPYTDGQKIIYGNSVTLEFNFTPKLENLTTYKYSARFSYEFNNNLKAIRYLNENGETLQFFNSFIDDNLICGEYFAIVKVTMIISHQFSVSKEVTLSYQIDKKNDVSVNFDSNSLSYIYDGKSHKPEVSFNGIYDIDMAELEFSFDRAPAVNAGDYEFAVTSINNPNYELADRYVTNLHIDTKKLSIEWTQTEKIYNGSYQSPDYKVFGIINGEFITVTFAETGSGSELRMRNVDTYHVSVAGVSSQNYQFEGNTNCSFTIYPAKITITFDNISERFTIAPVNRKPITYKVTGDLYDDISALSITYTSLGVKSTESGEFPIIGSYSQVNDTNKNYETTFVDGTYTILGYYYVFYTLPNGETYVETVDDGYNPIGITKDIYKIPLFSKYEYDTELVGNGITDLYVKVTVKSYSWVFWFAVIIGGFVVIYYFSSRKSRRNHTR